MDSPRADGQSTVGAALAEITDVTVLPKVFTLGTMFITTMAGLPGAVVLAALMVFGVSMARAGGPVALGGVIVLAIAALALPFGLARRWQRSRQRRLSAGFSGPSLAPLFRELLYAGRRPRTGVDVGDALKTLAAAGWAGHTVRVCRPDAAAPLQPLTVPFEPQLIDEDTVTVRELRGAPPSGRLGGREARAKGGTPPIPPAPGAWKRFLLHRGGWVVPMSLGFYGALEWLGRGRLTWTFAVVVTAVLLILGALAVGGTISPKQWLAVTGGIVVRSPRGLRRFTRSDAIFCVRQSSRHAWAASVADAQTCEHRLLSTLEVEFALRAWLSPLPPPPVDKLTDFV